MATKVQEAVIEEPKVNPLASHKGKTVAELKEIAVTLQDQFNDANTKATQYQSLKDNEVARRTKAQGALEVILQLIPKEEVESMVADAEGKTNNKMNGKRELD